MTFPNVTPEYFAQLRQRLIEAGIEITCTEVPAGETPTSYKTRGHGVETSVTYRNNTLDVEVTKKPFYVTLDHIQKGLREALEEPKPSMSKEFLGGGL